MKRSKNCRMVEKPNSCASVGAGALVDAEMQHGVGRTGMQAAAAGFADADLLGQRPVGFELKEQ